MKQLDSNQVQTILREKCCIQPSDKLLVAVSGGADSMALLHLMHQLDYNVDAAHCNFCLRGEESDTDQQLVEKFCQQLDISCRVIAFETEKYASEHKVSIEMAARELRYEWFEQLRKEYGYAAILTGHHGDDSIETFFLNLVRGTGIKGLSGIASLNGFIARPFLDFSRACIEKYCQNHDVPFRHDASNDDTKYLRNKIRHEIIPVLTSINPSFFDTMQSNLAHLKDVEGLLELEVKRFKEQVMVDEHGKVIIPISKLEDFPQYASILFEVLRPYGFNTSIVEDVCRHLQGGSGKQFFSDQYRLIKDRHNLLVVAKEEQGVDHFWVEEGATDAALHLEVKIYERPKDFQFSKDSRLVHLDADLVDTPLLVRKWKQGDAFMPLGMKNFKKISDFFIDQKFSLTDKEEVWLMISGEEIVWIVGHRLDDRFKVTNRTRNILEVVLK
jgi:tRNA(Ile)-lysidine synthase